MHVGQHLVAADVERAEGHRPVAGRLEHGLVERVLLAGARELRGDHELQLGAEQPDAVGAGLLDMRQVDQQAGIEVEADHRGRRGSRLGRLPQRQVLLLPAGAEPHLLGIGRLDLGRRADLDLAGAAVDDDGVAVLDEIDDVLDLADGGDAERAGDDGDMAGRPALLEHEAAQALAVIVEQLGRPHGAGDEDGVLRAASRAGDVMAVAGQLAQQPVGEVVEIVQPLAQDRVGDAQHAGAGVVLHPLDRGLGGEAGGDRLAHPATQPRSLANIR